MTEKVTPDSIPMSIEQADYLLAAVVGMAQGLRLVPLDDLADHFNRRRRDARIRGDESESLIAEGEAVVTESAYALVAVVERLMDTRRAAQVAAVESAKAEAQVDPATLPPSRRPLADDDVWANVPPRPAR